MKQRRHTPGLLSAALSAMVLAGCSEGPSGALDLPTEPPAAQDVAAWRPSVGDASDRLLPGVGDPRFRAALEADLVALDAALQEQKLSEGRERVRSAQRRLDDYRTRPEAAPEGPDLSAIELILDRARMLLGLGQP